MLCRARVLLVASTHFAGCSGTGALSVSLTHYKLMSTPAFLAAAVVLGLAGAFALIKHRSKKTIPRLPDAKLD